MTEEIDYSLSLSDFEEKYAREQALRDKQESSKAVLMQEQEDVSNNEVGKIIESDIVSSEDDNPGVFDYMAGFGKHVGVGVAKGFEEAGQTFGMLNDNAWNLPEPKNLAESFGQGIGQFLPMFTGGGLVLKGGLKMANLLQKGGKLSTAGRNLTAIGAGAFSDVVAFDPKDQNLGNLALSVGAISSSPRTVAFINEYLAQNDEDSELVARSKNALTGMVAGALVEGLVRGAGYSYRSYKKHKGKHKVETEAETNIYGEEEYGTQPLDYTPITTRGTTRGGPTTRGATEDVGEANIYGDDEYGIPPKELEEIQNAADELAPEIIEKIIDPLKGGAKSGEKTWSFPGVTKERAAAEELNKPYISTVWEDLRETQTRMTEEIMDVWYKIGQGENIDLETMFVTKTFTKPDGTKVTKEIPLIESMNFLKLDTDEQVQHALQFFSRVLDIKKLSKPYTKTDDLSVIIPELVDDFIDVTDADGMQRAINLIGQQANNVDEAIRYVGTAKILSKLTYDKIRSASKKAGSTGAREDMQIVADLTANMERLLRASGLLSFKSGQLLRAWQKKVRPENDKGRLQAELIGEASKSTIKVEQKGQRRYTKLVEQDNNQRKELLEEISANVEFEGLNKGLGKRKVTVTASDTPRGKPKADRIKKIEEKIKKIPTIAERLVRKIKGKKVYIDRLRSPSRGEQQPKMHPVMDDPELKHLDGQIAKIKAERDTKANKFKKEAKEQLKVRETFDRLSKEIEDIDNDIVKAKKDKTLEPTELSELRARKVKAQKAAKERMSQSEKDQIQIDKLEEQYTDALLKRIEKDPTIGQQTESGAVHPKIKELKNAIRREKNILKERITRKELEETLVTKARKDVLDEINKMSLRQLKTRVGAMQKSVLTKTTDGMMEIYINGLLSSFKTLGQVNPIGNTSAYVSTIIERAFAGALGDQIAMREAAMLSWNFISGMPDAFRVFASAMKHGTNDLDVKLDFVNPRERALSKEAFNVGGNLGKTIDFMGTVVNMPGKILLSQDEAFKGLVVRGEQRALAWRKARNKFMYGDTRIPATKDQIQKEFDKIMSDIGSHPDITEGARELAAKTSFTNDLSDRMVIDKSTGKEKPVPGLSKSIQHTLDKNNLLKIFVPFFRTPVNILNFTWERTPILQFANRNLRNELTSDNPAIKQIAMARVGTSMGITTAMFGMALSGNFTGPPPRDRNLRLTMERSMGGVHWHSFNLGGGWKKYDRFDPYGILMASSASMATMAKTLMNIKEQIQTDGDDTGKLEEKYNEVINATILGTAELIKNRHYIQGISEFISFISGDSRGLTPSIKRIATVANPSIGFYSSLRRGVTRGIDTAKPRRLQRGVGTVGKQNFLSKIAEEIGLAHEEALRDVIPGYGTVSPEKDLVGNIVAYPGTDGEFDTIHNLYNTSITASPSLVPSKSPLINKLAELESKVEQPSSIKKIGNVILSEEEKDYIIDTWTTLNKRLAEPLINTSMFKNSGAGIQKLILETLIRKNKAAAKKLGLVKFERLRQGFMDYKLHSVKSKVDPSKTQGFQPPDLFNLQPQGQQ